MKRIKSVSVQEMNEILDEAKKYSIITYQKWDNYEDKSLATDSFVVNSETNFSITTKFCHKYNNFGKACTYQCRKDGEMANTIQGQEAYIQMQRMWQSPTIEKDSPNPELRKLYKILNWSSDGKCNLSASPLVDTNKKFDNQEIDDVYAYDLNSAYAIHLMKPLPDTTHFYEEDFVKENQVGFMLDDKLTLRKPGQYANIIFDMLDYAPLKKFAEIWYKRKKEAPKNSVEKARAKAYLNYCIGYWQLKNPFLRAFIVNSCNNQILSLLDENSIHWNTDAIYSKGRRPDLEKNIGKEIGQWEIEHQGTMRVKGCCYQFPNEDLIAYKHVPKSWFKKHIDNHGSFNILTDDLPVNGNSYEYNYNKVKLEEIK